MLNILMLLMILMVISLALITINLLMTKDSISREKNPHLNVDLTQYPRDESRWEHNSS